MPRHSQPAGRKIATCCFCGTRAVLILDRDRHELACANCGAPLRDLKSIPQPAEKTRKKRPASVTERRLPRARHDKPSRGRADARRPTKKRRKPMFKRLWEELWDEIEDIFD